MNITTREVLPGSISTQRRVRCGRLLQRCFTSVVLGASVLLVGCWGRAQTAPGERIAIDTSMGTIEIVLDADKAPRTVENFLRYVDAGYYVGTVFHRVIPRFMIQGGGLDGALQEKVDGVGPPVANEAGNGLRNESGTVAMARTAAPDSATTQFFINVADNPSLDRERAPDKAGYTVFAHVVGGMDVVRAIESVRTNSRGRYRDVPVQPVTISAVRRLAQ